MLLGLIVGPIITLFGRKVTFQTTESFSDLLQNNKNIEDKMVKFTKVIYFDDEINSSETVWINIYVIFNIYSI